MRAGMSAVLMWSTVTVTPTCLPHSLAKSSNHLSWRGTKWLHIRILRVPLSFEDGSVKVVFGAPPAPPVEAAPLGSELVSSALQAASVAAARPLVTRNDRREMFRPDTKNLQA